MKSELIKPIHLARRAVVYIRQSTTHQVVTNQESLRLQYALRQRDIELGWPEAGIDVIDADLGISGASAAQRSGFKELVGRVGLKEVGLILSIDVTRLARNCSDWYPLLDICGLHGCLIADRDGVYDPGSANGRLLLGLKGTISELELHTIRSRLTAGLLAKAERGELALTLPIGLVRDPSGVVVKDPNLEVQERLELLFETFLKVRTIAKVMREFNDRGLELPRRDRHGDLHWARATTSAVAAILKNPAYAGAFVYGRTRLRRPSDGRLPTKVPKPIEQWRIIVKDRYPPYIAWQSYEKIRGIVSDNRAEYMRNKTRGAPREGELLLQGIAWCGRCGHKMYARYKGGAEYVCNHLHSHQGLPACQYIRARRVDAAVAQAFLTALAPAEIDALSCARRAQQQAYKAMQSGAEQQLERRRYEAALAERQFNRVDPDNRLVAAELECRWEVALKEVRVAEEALARLKSPQAIAQITVGNKVLNDKVVRLSGRLPEIWTDPGTTDAKRKALLRCLIDKVILDRGEHDVVRMRIVWRGGAVTDIEVKMRVNSVADLTQGAEMRERVLELARAKMHDDEIAAKLTSEGHRSPNCPDKVLPITVQRIRLHAGLKGLTEQRTRWRHSTDLLSAQQLAGVLNIPVNWLYVQIRQGRLLIDRHPSGAHLFSNTSRVIEAVRKLRNHELDQLDLRITEPHEEGHQHA
ncbi:recombinase family protein [Bradyrhizobium japonicum]|uniref:recombinase family protein n=1 Tax=Bradyrhizobium japonicum TaxID=375 RepID=UPI0004255971|nr:recombinase family protein [Bradyrhizobium japonicum]WLB88853.1 recombinase family protein [Bradyrhizobium japonicum USDA 135]